MADVSTLLAADSRAGEQSNYSLDGLIQHLRRSIAFHSFRDGLRLVRSQSSFLELLGPSIPGSGVLLGLAAFWTSSVTCPEAQLISDTLLRYRDGACSDLSLTECAHVYLARGFTALRLSPAIALEHFSRVQEIKADLLDRLAILMSFTGMARSYRRSGRLEEAGRACDEAVAIARSEQWYGILAALEVFAGWIHLLSGQNAAALQLFERAHPLLISSTDYATLGSLHSARGRIARAIGNYENALEDFQSAACAFRLQRSTSSRYARALLEIAATERLLAQSPNAPRKPAALRKSALRHCCDSEALFRTTGSDKGLASVHSVTAAVYFDLNKLERAEAEAKKGLELERRASDLLLRTRLLVLLCHIENAWLECGSGREENVSQRYSRAQKLAAEALRIAEQTDSRHLVVRAGLCKALTECNLGEISDALDLSEKIARLITPDISGLVREDLTRLRKRLARVSAIETRFRDWSLGATGSRSFQQIAGEFEGVLIRSVWEKEHRDIARTAKKLSLTQRRVHRVLKRLQLLPPTR